ncbi:MAG: sulfotransferase [Halioglobus sp.]
MKPLDFLVIGAQKCATTALFEYLRGHPEVKMPLEKEVPFFSGDDYDDSAWRSFSSHHFNDEDDLLWGKASPQYLCDKHAPERIKALMPKVKLIAILRDPIERSWSHYQMGRRRETECRDFDTAVNELLQTSSLKKAAELPVPTHAMGHEPEGEFYLSWSEYGRLLQRYTQLFDSSQILVLYTEDLKRDPAGTLDKVLEFIGLDAGYRPQQLGEVIHRGGGSNRVPHKLRVWLRERSFIYRLWQWVPDDKQGRLRFLYEQWNVRKEDAPVRRMSIETESRLQQHFAKDLEMLSELSGQSPPWIERFIPS